MHSSLPGDEVGESPENLLLSFEGIDLMATFTKCCGAHELLDSDLSGSVVKNVTEREEFELIALRLLPKRAQCAILF
ncbi:hypothetical protein CesoFtcFv8_025939 [Champsocephalus esox]|uniref:Uncharacterized protein n=1 Tax=Champsocephalus esox TaxID=159716 RepID=A0AAN8GC41_9TELE|nr:hypothetical protein CesoFtcFv8_025939 [Champsocephalus esox]